ncbi:FHA domain-containing protein [Roseimaritima ulvae]|uniref:FHA domain-containing protein FhaB n=1 Tax=Roseimaritima ulvae TaxID=980254 RepID=A0A5B9QKN6_9BACT|nr:FHA domain-containing protein [Roseimaritima ulvae]QEG38105.1 FHA domain-containing protein FhaB [Roseimaritima ulvae]
MPEQSWTIGSDASCDLVVKNNTVSGQHCRLTSNAEGLTLTDLGSTNGTFVNGQRLHGSQTIQPTDRITLGQTQRMPWPPSLPTTAQIITLGRGTDNTIRLSDTNVSTHHARLLLDGDNMVLEDLGSTNGTSIGKVENKISRAPVQPSDKVFLGSTAYQVSDWLREFQGAPPAAPIRVATTPRAPRRRVQAPLAAVATVSTVLLVGLIGWWGFRVRGDAPTPPSATPLAADPELDPRPRPATVVHAAAGESSSPDSVREEPHTQPASVALSPEDQQAASLYLILCSDSQQETAFRVGSGFAIDAEHIATSASVIQAMQHLQQNGFPQAFLYSPAAAQDIAIQSTVIHPDFQKLYQQARQAQREHDALFDQLESQPPEPETFEEVKDRLIAARVKALEAIDRKIAYDVAILRVDQPLPHWLSGSSSDSSLRPNQKLQVTGCAFDREDPYFDRGEPLEPSTVSSRVAQLVKASADSHPRLVAKGSAEQHQLAFLGSPVLNSQGQVVAIYSRPSPQGPNPQPDGESLYDAALFQRLRECLPQQPKPKT